jgi:1,4-alpha-glucan branching enzyme
MRQPTSPGAGRKAWRKVEFQFRSEPERAVFVAGSFNAWNATEHPLRDPERKGVYRATLKLAPGRWEYKFIVDGAWCVDPECPEWARNQYGSLNSVLTVD